MKNNEERGLICSKKFFFKDTVIKLKNKEFWVQFCEDRMQVG